MTDLPAPRAPRLTAPSWRDARLAVGVLLVLASTVLGSVIISSADHRVPVYAARVALVPGRQLGPDQLVRVDVQLGDAAAAYLTAGQALPAEQYVMRAVAAGELVPRSALGGRGEVALQAVTLTVPETSAAGLVEGSIVDVYANPPREGGGSGDLAGPERVLEAVSVSALPGRSDSLVGPSRAVAVQVMVPSGRVRRLIGLVDAEARVTLVPVPGSRLGTTS